MTTTRTANPTPDPVNPPDLADDRNGLVHPYTVTGGRTRSRLRLAPEAMARSVGRPSLHPDLLPEHQDIVLLCHTPTALMEIAATVALPLGVAEVLVADLTERGLLTIDQTEPALDGRPTDSTLQRVLSGLLTVA